SHFAPGSYQHFLPAKTPIPNFYLSGDWVMNQHGSWSQEKAYVTGLEAANLVIDQFKQGKKAEIIPVEADEAHIQLARWLNRSVRTARELVVPKFSL
ncbi:MAG: amine oxidase, partial [Kamptonema sp. SIO4C4]|nr:amine oxidase [Kamptonema sp. SIO4C4]